MLTTAPINLTPTAVFYLKKSLQKYPNAIGIRIGVKDSGCSGKAYVIDYASDITSEDDTILEIDGLKIIVDNASIAYIKGTTLDCVQEGLNELLKFINPNVVNECGCGESFQVKTEVNAEISHTK